MDEVNLLPWREQKIVYERTLLQRYVMFVVLLALLILAACHWWFAAQSARHEQHFSELQSLLPDNNEVPEGAESEGVTALTPAIFAELSATRAHGLCYSKLEYGDHQVTLTGQAVTYTGLLQAIQQLGASGEFGSPHLLHSKQEKPGSPLQFVINTSEW